MIQATDEILWLSVTRYGGGFAVRRMVSGEGR